VGDPPSSSSVIEAQLTCTAQVTAAGAAPPTVVSLTSRVTVSPAFTGNETAVLLHVVAVPSMLHASDVPASLTLICQRSCTPVPGAALRRT